MPNSDGHVEEGCAECVTLAADLNLFRAVAADGPLEIERREDDARAETFRERLRREVRTVHAGATRGGRDPRGNRLELRLEMGAGDRGDVAWLPSEGGSFYAARGMPPVRFRFRCREAAATSRR